MKREEYLDKISEKCGVTKVVCDKVIDAFIEEIKNKLKENDHVNITNFGVFNKTLIKPKVMFSPTDGKTLECKEYYRIGFTCSKNFIEELKK